MRKMATFYSDDNIKRRLQATLYQNRKRRLKRIEDSTPPEPPEPPEEPKEE